ncbi:spidroin-2-like [Helicoverpa armigera]|uniref:spidroin-2-like n=1 Tax=Helicoverpa armigera TaxID=29058 RepID=UPI0030835412
MMMMRDDWVKDLSGSVTIISSATAVAAGPRPKRPIGGPFTRGPLERLGGNGGVAHQSSSEEDASALGSDQELQTGAGGSPHGHLRVSPGGEQESSGGPRKEARAVGGAQRDHSAAIAVLPGRETGSGPGSAGDGGLTGSLLRPAAQRACYAAAAATAPSPRRGPPSAQVSRPYKCADLRILGLDDSVTTEEVAAVSRMGRCSAEEVKAGTIRPNFRGMSTITVSCPVAAAKIAGWLDVGAPRRSAAAPSASAVVSPATRPWLAAPRRTSLHAAGRPNEHRVESNICAPPVKTKDKGRRSIVATATISAVATTAAAASAATPNAAVASGAVEAAAAAASASVPNSEVE